MEHIKTTKLENVRMLDRYSKTPLIGTLFLTTSHLIFVDPEDKKETWIAIMHIANLEKLPLTTTGSPLLIRCKNFLSVTFVIPRERDCHDIYLTLQLFSQPSNVEDLYCFTYKAIPANMSQSTGWDFYDLQSEYKRMGVPNDQWGLTNLNKDYELCDTYPRHLHVPLSATTTTLMGSSRFRSKGRLPVLSYLHHNKASISRCSQPLSGFSARCVEDEKMFNHVLKTNPNSSYMYVVDTRPKINAFANKAAGKGYENEAFYENIKFHFLGVENIHVMRNSLDKVIETCEQKNPTINSFLSGLESSGWLRHIKSILDTSWFIAQALEEGISVVVHCSDGWDRTAQVCSLASILLDPYYRTITGYQALIEKDWLAFGHKFSERCGHVQSDSKEVSPIFTQLLDATWQLMQQFPLTFQFNERFLLNLHDHVHSCQYGTFVGNCEKDRLDLRLSERTYSLWGKVARNINEFLNPLYSPEETTGLLTPNLVPQNIKFWRGMYCGFESGVHPREPIGDILLDTCDHTSSLEDHIKYLTKRISSVKALLLNADKRSIEKKPDNTNSTDNKFLYEKASLRELESADHDHPLKLGSEDNQGSDANEKVGEITKDLNSVALDWKAVRSVTECSCSKAFDQFTRKYHCRKCGDIFCMRCIDQQCELPGHMSRKPMPVCRPCYDNLQTVSFDGPE
ncbi:PREDICTED: myotubularin-related protein 6 isoform X2 [Nicrophorus vespilloides]|uniref:phosphatidylinositol-3,5-bisphosphate 3-phosphatase n=1 Tax=Nicrophorus vespilloides TaxID=110193 RepID=A0ABM1NC94_NICVS|nr:PREDICTED: myotubularin-related protein 6 isoform X2 [Nicrophorus vespilloides]